MNIQKTTQRIAGILALAALFPLAAPADGVLHGRVSFDAGGTMVKGTEESDWSSATVNTLVLPGDTLWVDNGGSSEVEFSGGTFLRMADGSKAEVVDMPPNATVRGWIGSFYVQRLSRSSGSMMFYTPAAIIEIDNDASVRIDIVSEGVTTVSTRWGRATVRTEAGGTVEAHAGRRVYIEAGMLPSEPTPFDRTAEDAFDQWNRERAEFLATGGSTTPASVPIGNDTLGAGDLDRYGEWVTIDSTPYWRPTVVVDYTPYHNGYWNYVGNVGNVWVGNYPFCYVTSHYGYWDYNRTYGWVWGYRPQWSPAWCATVQYGDYFVWAPVNRYYRPVYPTTSAYFNIGGVSFGYFGSSYCHVNSLYSGPSYVYYANHDPFRRYYGSPNVTINIWNINTGDRRPHVRVPYNDSVTTVRDYTPRRRIRGAETLYASGRSASDRVRSLESTSGRESFSRTTRTGGEFARTDEARIDRGSRTRNVSIDQQAPDYTRASRSNPVVASNTRTRGAQEDESVTVSNTRDRQGGTRTQAGLPSETESTRTGAPDRGGDRGGDRGVDRGNARGNDRGESATEPSRTARTDIDPGTSPARTRSTTPARTRTQEPGRTAVPEDAGVTPGNRTRSVEPESFGNTRPANTGRTRSQEPGRTPIPESENAAPATRTRSVEPESSGTSRGSRSTAEPTRTPTRTSVPEVNNESGRTSVPRNSGGTVDRTPSVRSSAPATRERTEPRESYTPPSRTVAPERSAPSVSSTRQTRTVEPVREPERRVQQVPDVEREVPLNRAPVRSNVESRAIPQEAPQSSGRSYSAPTRNEERAPSFQAPRVESGRGGNIESAPRSSGGDSGGRASGARESGGRESGGRGR